MLTSGIILIAVVGLASGAETRTTLLDVDDLLDIVFRLGFANNYFAVNLHRELADDTEGNVFFSPFSVASVLAMLHKGAAGETADELERVLGYGGIIDADDEVSMAFHFYLSTVIGRTTGSKAYTIDCVSAMLIDNTFPVNTEFKSEMRDVFGAYVEDVNMAQESAAAVARMNTWAKIKSRGNIQCLADSLDPETTVFLASAAFFKGAWRVKFEEKDTKLHPFYNGGLKSNVSNVWMMHASPSIRYFEDEDVDFTAVELFYEGRDISMVIYLPNELDGLHSLEKYMTASNLSQVRNHMYPMKVHLTMPRFKLNMDRSLMRPLKNLGVNKVFSLKAANLTVMVPGGSSLCLDDIRHKATIEVNEKGTVAAAVTRSIMTKSMSLPIPDPEFKVDHPFMFAVFDIRSDMVLFLGRINHFENQTA